MKILIIAPRLPYPLFSGGEHAQFHFINVLRNEANVTLCFEMKDNDYNSGKEDLIRLKEKWANVTFSPFESKVKEKKPLKFYRKLKQKAFNFIFRKKIEKSDLIREYSLINNPFLTCNPGFVEHVLNIVKNNSYDIIQVEFIYLAPLVYILPKASVKVLVHHELRFIRVMREAELFKYKCGYDSCRLEAIKDQEISLLKKFDKIITLTEVDRNILGEYLSKDSIYVSPATIELKKTSSDQFLPFKNKLTFIGSSMHLPNLDGMKWFIESILPLIENKLPDVYLNVIGSWDSNFIKKYSKQNVFFLGYVQDLNKALYGSLLVVPIRIGSGMRLKILDAVQCNRPFVTTSVGVEGLNFDNNQDCYVVDSSAEFAEKIIKLSSDVNLQRRFIVNASTKLENIYGFDMAISKRMNFYKFLATGIS